MVEPVHSSEEPLPEAVQFMQEYSRLENAFDPAFAELIHDDARIVMTVVSKEGTRDLSIPTPKFKQLMRNEMLLGTFQPYSISYRIESAVREVDRIRIIAVRRTEPRGFEGRINLLIGRAKDSRWQIFEQVPVREADRRTWRGPRGAWVNEAGLRSASCSSRPARLARPFAVFRVSG